MKTYTIEELNNVFSEGTYPYVALFSDTNKMMVPYPANTAVQKGKPGWERVKKRLLSKGLADGFYIVKGKSSPLKNISADVFYFKNGDVKEKELPSETLAEKPKEPDSVLTYDAAIKSNKDIAELTADVNRLEMEIKQKNDDIEELEAIIEEYEDEVEGLAANGKVNEGRQYVEDLVATAIPVVDRYFDLQEKKLALRAQQMNGGQHRLPAQPPPTPQEPSRPAPTKEEAKAFWDKMAVLLEEDPQEYQRVMQKIQSEQGFDAVNNE